MSNIAQSYIRQMYTGDSEEGKRKLQSVKENLYEATTKVVLYSIEMYSKKELSEWVKTDLLKNLDHTNNVLIKERADIEQGLIGMMDVTNGSAVINSFVRKNALAKAREDVQKEIASIDTRIEVLNLQENLLNEKRVELEKAQDSLNDVIKDEVGIADKDVYSEATDNNIYDIDNEEEYDFEYEQDNEDEDENPSETQLFIEQLESIVDIEELSVIQEEIDNERATLKRNRERLFELTKASGKNLLGKQDEEETNRLDNLRTLRNSVYAHKNEDEQQISMIGSWEPEAGPLYQWASEILRYIKTIESRYLLYALFDEYYKDKEGKDKFDSCKIYVQKQVKELYVNRKNTVFEFAGGLYDKDDDEYNFNTLIEDMAINWDTGIRYLTIVSNDDLPEMNVFFKECLSGTDRYVNKYLVDRNSLRELCRRGDYVSADYSFFRLIYHMNPGISRLYWREKSYSQREFARQIIYKYIKAKSVFQFEGRLKDYEKYLDGIDICGWCRHRLLSDVFFAVREDGKGIQLSRTMEDAILDYFAAEGSDRSSKYRKAIKASVQLYFYMGQEYTFAHTRTNGKNIYWKSLDDARRYLEDTRKFKSYDDVCVFIEELYKSEFFRAWRMYWKNKMNERGVQF